MKKILLIQFLFPLILFSQSVSVLHTGFRASRILSSYPGNQFPSPEYWQNTGEQMAAKFDSAVPAGIWIVGLYMDNGYTKLNFPSPGGTYENIWFSNEDQNEEWLTYFDQHGLKVWLQVEPGAADIPLLMQLILEKYGDHSCITGFGVDVEWYQPQQYPEGKPVTDAEAQLWENTLKSYDSTYNLFLKHYLTNRMPPEYRGDILFVDDSQDFSWANNPLDYMVNEFSNWAATFSPSPSAFQFGYPADQSWWEQFDDPPDEIGEALLQNIPGCKGLFWVDFTITQIFPVSAVAESFVTRSTTKCFPNPARTKTAVEITVPENTTGYLEFSDIFGNVVLRTHKTNLIQGVNRISLDIQNLKEGVYLYKFIGKVACETNILTVVK